jgi:hypothetical protein
VTDALHAIAGCESLITKTLSRRGSAVDLFCRALAAILFWRGILVAKQRQKDPRILILRETHEAPESVARALQRAGGVNRFGEPNYRAVWGWNRLAWIGGKFEERDPETGSLIREVVELRQEPKYPAVNRWHIEKWMAPETYGSPRAWYAQTIERENGVSIPALGPYPVRGEYEHCFTLEGPKGEFLQLTATIAEHIARAIEYSRRHPSAVGKRRLYEREEREEKNYDAWAFDVLDEAAPAFHQQPFVTVA